MIGDKNEYGTESYYNALVDARNENRINELEMQIRQLELTIEELDAAHQWFDSLKVPRRERSSGLKYSLVGRIVQYKNQ